MENNTNPQSPDFMELILNITLSCLKFKKQFFGIIITITAISIIVALVLPKSYASQALVNPPTSKSVAGGLGKILSSGSPLMSLIGKDINTGDNSDLILSILSTKELHEKLINKFNLKERYEFDGDFYADLLKKFRKNIEYDINDEDVLEILIEDSNPDTASLMVSYIIDILDSTYTSIKSLEASRTKTFFKQRLKENELELLKSSEALAQFQKESGIYSPKSQIEKSLDILAQLEAQKEIIKVEALFEKNSHGKSTPQYTKLRTKQKAIQSSIQSLMVNHDKNNITIALQKSPELAIKYAMLEKEVKIRETIYKYLRQRYEELGLEEAQNQKALVVIQEPWVNDKRVSPPRRGIVTVALFISLVIAITFCVLKNFVEEEEKANSNKHQIIKEILKNISWSR